MRQLNEAELLTVFGGHDYCPPKPKIEIPVPKFPEPKLDIPIPDPEPREPQGPPRPPEPPPDPPDDEDD